MNREMQHYYFECSYKQGGIQFGGEGTADELVAGMDDERLEHLLKLSVALTNHCGEYCPQSCSIKHLLTNFLIPESRSRGWGVIVIN